MADTHVKLGGAWKAIDNCSVKVGGAWKQVQTIYVKVGGAWKEAWNNYVVTLTNATASGSGATPPTVGFRWNSDGTVDRLQGTWAQINASTDWVIPNAAVSEASFVIRFTEDSADPGWAYVSGESLVDGSTWHALSSIRTITGNNSLAGTATCQITAAISADGGSTTLDTGVYTFSSEDLA